MLLRCTLVFSIYSSCGFLLGPCGALPQQHSRPIDGLLPSTANANRSSVLLLIVDNLRPSLGVYTNNEALTPHMDRLAEQGTVFAQAYCQEAWCAPSRNSFLSGRRPSETLAFGFRDSFREVGVGKNWTSMPQFFKEIGNFSTVRSFGKVFHPHLPLNFDFPKSWTQEPFFVDKPPCPNMTMSCGVVEGGTTALKVENEEVNFVDADNLTAAAAIQALRDFVNAGAAGTSAGAGARRVDNFFIAVGFQGPRLPWSFPQSVLSRYPPQQEINVTRFQQSMASDLEWFRPTEVDQYSDVRNITHSAPLDVDQQRRQRLAYYATITHVDDCIGAVLGELDSLQLSDSTAVILTADHGQNLGEYNMWSMMNLMDTSLRVPLIIRPPVSKRTIGRSLLPGPNIYPHPVELVDLYPTAVRLAGFCSAEAPLEHLPGVDLSPALMSLGDPATAAAPLKSAAMSQITRCRNCTVAYTAANPEQCTWDEASDGGRYTVPCALTPRSQFDWMGYSIRTSDGWRFSVFCPWNGSALRGNFSSGCEGHRELFDLRDSNARLAQHLTLLRHQGDDALPNHQRRFTRADSRAQLFDPDDPAFSVNLAGNATYSDVEARLFDLLVRHFSAEERRRGGGGGGNEWRGGDDGVM